MVTMGPPGPVVCARCERRLEYNEPVPIWRMPSGTGGGLASVCEHCVTDYERSMPIVRPCVASCHQIVHARAGSRVRYCGRPCQEWDAAYNRIQRELGYDDLRRRESEV
jgi:hypothetical protein